MPAKRKKKPNTNKWYESIAHFLDNRGEREPDTITEILLRPDDMPVEVIRYILHHNNQKIPRNKILARINDSADEMGYPHLNKLQLNHLIYLINQDYLKRSDVE